MSCDKAVSQLESDDVNAKLVNNTDSTIQTDLASYFSNFGCTPDEADFINSNENLVIQNDECSSIDANRVNNNTHMTDPNSALASSSKGDFISDQDNRTAQYNIEVQHNTDPITLTISLADKLDSSKENNTAQIQGNGGPQQVPHPSISYDTKVINDKTAFQSLFKIKCTECGDSPWNASYLKSRNCPKCCTERLLYCVNCNKQYNTYTSMSGHLNFICQPRMSYRCLQCGYNTYNKHKMKRHLVSMNRQSTGK